MLLVGMYLCRTHLRKTRLGPRLGESVSGVLGIYFEFHIFVYLILKLQTHVSMHKDVGTTMTVGFAQAGSHFSVPQTPHFYHIL